MIEWGGMERKMFHLFTLSLFLPRFPAFPLSFQKELPTLHTFDAISQFVRALLPIGIVLQNDVRLVSTFFFFFIVLVLSLL